jgi:hypothetical protein
VSGAANIEEGTMTQTDFERAITPFRPFRIVMSSGEVYDVRHREGFILTPTYINIGLLPGPGTLTYERTMTIDLFHVVRVEDLQAQVPPQAGDGQTTGGNQ